MRTSRFLSETAQFNQSFVLSLLLTVTLISFSPAFATQAHSENPQSAASVMTNSDLDELRRAANSGDANAAHRLGRYYLFDSLTCGTPATANKKRISSDEMLQMLLDERSVEGVTALCDTQQGIHWLLIATKAFLPRAIYDLGYAYDDIGEESKAVQAFLQAAIMGHPKGQLSISIAALNGRTIQPNLIAAYFWARLASENDKTYRDSRFAEKIGARLSPDEKSRADAIVIAYKQHGVISYEVIHFSAKQSATKVCRGTKCVN